jgi:hypothetical protein
MGKYKYDTWRILSVNCYIDNSVHLTSFIRNVNKHFWNRFWGGSQYLLSIYRLHGIILTSIISLTDLSVALCLFMVFTGSCMTIFDLPTNNHTGSRISDMEVSLKAFFTRIFRIPCPRNCRQISGITTTTWTYTHGCPEMHQQFLSYVQCQRQDWSRDEHRR